MVKRLTKTTKKQYEELINFVSKNKILLTGKTHPFDLSNVDRLWNQFAEHVNSLGYGAAKSGTQWKNVFSEWKTNTKRKARKAQRLNKMIGDTYNNVYLTASEQKLLQMIPELGRFPHSDKESIAEKLKGQAIIEKDSESPDVLIKEERIETHCDYEEDTLIEINQSDRKEEVINRLVDAINKFTTTYETVERAKLKLEYFKVYGTLEGFQNVFQ